MSEKQQKTAKIQQKVTKRVQKLRTKHRKKVMFVREIDKKKLENQPKSSKIGLNPVIFLEIGELLLKIVEQKYAKK